MDEAAQMEAAHEAQGMQRDAEIEHVLSELERDAEGRRERIRALLAQADRIRKARDEARAERDELLVALKAVGAELGGHCFCHYRRHPNALHTYECDKARSAIAKVDGKG